jgi:hypothetical protein
VTVLVARVLLAGMFAIAAMAKLADRGGVRRAVIAFGVPSAAAGLLGWALVGAEFCTALLLLIAPAARVGGVAALVLLVAFSATVVLNLARGRRPHCHCFGRLSSGPLGWSTVARNGCFATIAAFVALRDHFGWPLLALAIVMLGLWLGPSSHRRWTARAGAAATSFTLVDQAGQTWTLDTLLEPGRPLVLIFSQPGCRACDALLPEVARWQHGLDGRVTVAVVSGGPVSSSLAASAENGLRTVLVDGPRASFAAYGITATPSAVLIDGDQRLVAAPARGAGAIGKLVGQAMEASEEPRFTRRGVLGRAAVGLASVTVLPAVGAIASACGSSSKNTAAHDVDALEVDGAWLCNQTFALCTTAPCVPSTTDPKISVCDCVVQNGYSVGFKPCTERAQLGNTVRSEFSTVNVNASFGVMTCPSGVTWANCLDVECEIDPTNPAVAHCQCVTVRTGESLTFGGGCTTATCTSTIWSGTTPDLPGNAQYVKGMKQLGQPVVFPKTCPSPPPSTSTTAPR